MCVCVFLVMAFSLFFYTVVVSLLPVALFSCGRAWDFDTAHIGSDIMYRVLFILVLRWITDLYSEVTGQGRGYAMDLSYRACGLVMWTMSLWSAA